MSAAPTPLARDWEGGPPRFERLADWLAWQEELHFTAIELGLDRCGKVAARMGLLRPRPKVISISGTNGKGSSAAMLDAILRKSGYRVGTYTSPHLVNYNERICVNGQQATDEQLCRSFDRIDRARGDVSLTYFEFGTLAALDVFRQFELDVLVLEVGLGGRLDAVNMLDADAALVVTIDLDHEKWLGCTRERIGREKAGIFRKGRPAICSDLAAPDTIAACARETGARLYQAGLDFSCAIGENAWSWRHGDKLIENLPKPGLNDQQAQNAAGVLMVLTALADEFPVATETIKACLRDFRLAGRFQVVPDAPGMASCVLDVAHNRQAIAALVANLKKMPRAGETHIVAGMLKDKNHAAVFERLAEIADHWRLADLQAERAASAVELAGVLAARGVKGVKQFANVLDALTDARLNAGAADRIVVTGSFITVGAVIDHLNH